MVRGKIMGGVVLLLAVLAWGAAAEVTFVDQSLAAGYLDPGDVGIAVQRIRVSNTSAHPVRFDVITVRNRGTATHQEITRIELWDGGAMIGSVDDPIGLATGGVSVPVDYTLPAGSAVEITVRVNVADVAQIAGGETLELEVRFHYFVGTAAYTSSWIADGEGEEIKKAGFEVVEETDLPAGNYDPRDGVGNPVQQVTFTDDDANNSPIQVNSITVKNLGTAEGADITALWVEVTVNGTTYEAQTSSSVLQEWRNGGITFRSDEFEDELGHAWDGQVADDGSMEITVEIRVADDPGDGRTVRSAVVIDLVEEQPDGDQGFTQSSEAPTTQTIRDAGPEGIADRSTPPASGVLNPGEILTQTIELTDDDVNDTDVIITEVLVKNLGTATGAELTKITIRNGDGEILREFSGAEIAAFTTGLTLSLLNDVRPEPVPVDLRTIPDDESYTLIIQYVIGDIVPGHTIQPRIKVRSTENPPGPYETAAVDYPTGVELRDAGFEFVENIPLESATVYTGQRFVAQKIRLQDRDENHDGLTINPVVIRNLGTSRASDITKIEVRNAAGDLLGETTDVAGFDTGGVTISTLEHNTVPDDGSVELWIWVTVAAPEVATADRTIRLRTTVYDLESGAVHEQTVDGNATFTIAINHRPEVDFTWSPEEPTWEDDITFTPHVTDPDGDAIVWSRWDFGDGSDPIVREGPPEEVTHRYPDGGTFTVTLTVRDARGLEGSKAKEITVQPRPNRPPEVDFSWSPAEPGVNQEVTFTPHVTDPDGDEIASYRWDFGDGTAPVEGEGAPGPITHRYASAGDYEVTLVAVDSRGAEGSATKTVSVANRPPEITALTYEPTEPVTGQPVTFRATARDPDGDPIVAWEWDFGDGTGSDQAPPVDHTYGREGVYEVRVRAKDSGSGQWSQWFTETIYVRRQGGPEIGAYVAHNPVSTQAEIVFFMPPDARNAKLRIFDLLGRIVLETELVPNSVDGYTYLWDLKDGAGVDVPSGVYFFVITAERNGRALRSNVGRILVVRRGG